MTQNWQADYRQLIVAEQTGKEKNSPVRYYWQPLNNLGQIYTTQAAPDHGLLGITGQPTRDLADISTELGISPEVLLAQRHVDAARADLEKVMGADSVAPNIAAGPGNDTNINDGKPYTSNEITLTNQGDEFNQNKGKLDIEKGTLDAIAAVAKAETDAKENESGQVTATVADNTDVGDGKPYTSTDISLEDKAGPASSSHADGVKYNPKASSVPSQKTRPLYLKNKQTGQSADTRIINLPSSRGTVLEKLENQVKQDQQASQSSEPIGLTRTSHRVVVAQANRAQGDSKLATGLQDLGRQLGHSLAVVASRFSRPQTNNLEAASADIGRWLGEEEVTAADHKTDHVLVP